MNKEDAFKNFIVGLAREFKPKDEDVAHMNAIRRKLVGEVINANIPFFTKEYLMTQLKDEIPSSMLSSVFIGTKFEKSPEILSNIIDTWMTGLTSQVITSPGKMQLIGDNIQYARDVLLGDFGFENKVREAIIDLDILHRPEAKIFAIIAFCEAETLVYAFHKMCYELVYNREHIIWRLHKETLQ